MENNLEKSIFIIGGGPSIGQIGLNQIKKYETIVVNKSVFFVQNPTYFVTMDYSFLRKVGKARLKQIQGSKFFIVNRTVPYMKSVRGAMTDVRFNIIYEDIWDYFDNIIISRKHGGVGKSFDDFRHGGCSGQCALQLALLLGYQKIYLLGIDLVTHKGRTHFHSGYGRDKDFLKKLTQYYEDFKLGILEAQKKFPGVTITSCSSISKLNDNVIPYVPLEKL